MAFQDETFFKAAFKKLQGSAHTSNSKEPANEPLASQVLMAANQIIGEEVNSDPVVASGLGVIEFVAADLELDVTSNGDAYRAKFPTGYNGFFGAGAVGDFISDHTFAISPGVVGGGSPATSLVTTGYAVRLENNGVLVPATSTEDWFFDYFNTTVTSEDDLGLDGGTVDVYIYIGETVVQRLNVAVSGIEDNPLVGTNGITIVSGSNTIEIQGFRTEFTSASGSLQSSIDSIDSSVTLQEAYDNGDGTIASTSSKPVQTGDLTATGIVGIGTTSPQNLLHLQSNNTDPDTSQVVIEAGGISANATFATLEFKAHAAGVGVAPTGRIKAFNTSPAFASATMSFQTIAGGPSFVDTMSLRDGKVGIGTTTPIQELDVRGNVNVSGSIDINNGIGIGVTAISGGLNFNRFGDQGPFMLFQQNEIDIASIRTREDINLFTIASFDGGTQFISIKTDTGNVGIGNSSPDFDLDVVGSGNFSTDLTVGGNVSIGTTAPQQQLHTVITGNTPSIIRVDSSISVNEDVTQGIHLFKNLNGSLFGWKIEGSGELNSSAFLTFISSQSGVDVPRMSIARNSGDVDITGDLVVSGTVTAASGTFTEGITVGSGTTHIFPNEIRISGDSVATQSQIDLLNAAKISVGEAPVQSVFGRTGIVAAASNDYDAVQIDNTPAGNIAGTTVQAALNELDSEKTTTAQAAAAAPVQSVFGRTGGVTAVADDYADLLPVGVFRQALVNAEFRFAQRVAAGGIFANPSTGTMTLDRWKVIRTGTPGTIDIDHLTLPNPVGTVNGLRFEHQISGGNNNTTSMSVQQKVQDFKLFRGKTVSLSVLVRNLSGSDHGLGLKVQGPPGSTVVSTTIIPGSTTQLVTLENVTLSSLLSSLIVSIHNAGNDAADGFAFNFVQSGDLEIHQAQLNVGPLVLPYQPLEESVDFAQVQRWYEKSYDLSVAPGTNIGDASAGMENHVLYGDGLGIESRTGFNTRKAANPTVTIYDAGGTAARVTTVSNAAVGTNGESDFTVQRKGETGFGIQAFAAGMPAGAFSIGFAWTAEVDVD